MRKRILQKEENLDKKSEALDKREASIAKREKQMGQQERELGEKEKELHGLIEEQRRHLESLSGLSSEEAKDMLLQVVENEARHDAAVLVKKIEIEAREVSRSQGQEYYFAGHSTLCWRLCGGEDGVGGNPAQ